MTHDQPRHPSTPSTRRRLCCRFCSWRGVALISALLVDRLRRQDERAPRRDIVAVDGPEGQAPLEGRPDLRLLEVGSVETALHKHQNVKVGFEGALVEVLDAPATGPRSLEGL